MDDKQKLYEELSNSITRVLDANNVEILFTKAELRDAKLRYSSVGVESPTLFLDGRPLSTTRKYHIEYRCSCGRLNNILYVRFRKKTRLCCSHCREDGEKVRWHKLFFEMRKQGMDRGHKAKQRRQYDFDNEPEGLKEVFYQQNLTPEEFEEIKGYIFSIHDIPITKDTEIVFLEHENGQNGKKYRQMVLIDGEKYSLKEIKLKCPVCGRVFHISRPLKERVMSRNFLCKACSFSNNVFRIRNYRNGLTYQSSMESDFIKQCDKVGIKIEDGPVISYSFGDKCHEYRTDFYLPERREVIELKDDHVWHREQVKSGKWDAKEKAARDFCKEQGLEYLLLFPDDVDKFFLSSEEIV